MGIADPLIFRYHIGVTILDEAVAVAWPKKQADGAVIYQRQMTNLVSMYSYLRQLRAIRNCCVHSFNRASLIHL